MRRMSRAFPIVWYRLPMRRRPARGRRDRNGLRHVPAGLPPLGSRATHRTFVRRAELRSKIRDRSYLERAMRYLAQLLADGEPSKMRR